MVDRKEKAILGKTFGEVSKSIAKLTRLKSENIYNSEESRSNENIEDIEILPEYLEAKKLIEDGEHLIFVTGGAGTGKSTFVRWLANEFDGNTLICAPTGIAALTIGGKTIHSLCRFPPSWIVRDEIKPVTKSLASKAKLLIIDEVSMVNANLLDSMNVFFKINRNNKSPFGGISVVMVGDLFQLPPIVTSSTKPLFDKIYDSPKFFSAKLIEKSSVQSIELTKAFRQVDQEFVDLLKKIREGNDLERALEELNSKCKITNDPPEGAVWLAPRHVDVDRVNSSRLSKLVGKKKNYEGSIVGKFKENQLPVPISVDLKVGAQVILANNTKQWVNGTVAIVTKMLEDRIQVSLVEDDKKRIHEVSKYTWVQYDYKFNEKTEMIEKIKIGEYTQIPVILAWAMTIHKSQGLTIDKVHLDLGTGAFETGQTYVALSRCRSLKNLTLSKEVKSEDIKVDPESSAFYKILREGN
jgi:ATP-dependent exoDNAse (exonuclease V) alpha subunit